ncbi:hypothetical protein BSKO_05373 [Bryopsis sp. KO-2023]|nr:hypothetical protein BSKO_05373 [Bryopsis sp. KO-2023]
MAPTDRVSSDKEEVTVVASSKLPLGTCKLKDFDVGKVLGTGSFGRVFIAKHKPSGLTCAVKALSKAQIFKNGQLQHLKEERNISATLNNEFLVKLLGSFQDPNCVYLVLEFVPGGEFFTHLRTAGRFSEATAKFYGAEVLTAFEHLHSLNIVYRDLKPENMLLDVEGHVKVTDFGFAKIIKRRTFTLCGTPDYLAPEIILNRGHGLAVDWWAFGVLLYEMLAGYPPFYDDDPMTTYKRILAGRLEFPTHFSATARDLIKKLLQGDLTRRLGNLAGGVKDIKNHPWFKDIDFKAVAEKKTRPPIVPLVLSTQDTSNFEDYSSLPPMVHDQKLSSTEQMLFQEF